MFGRKYRKYTHLRPDRNDWSYMVNTLCTIQVYNYLPKNVSGVCAFITREKSRKNEDDV